MEINSMLSDSRRPSNDQDLGSSSRTPQQVRRLEQFYEKCPSPSITERKKLSDELGLEPNEISLWFQNQRYQEKAVEDSSEIVILNEFNEKLRHEVSSLRYHNSSLLKSNAELQHSESIYQSMLGMGRGFGATITPCQERALRNLSMQDLGSEDFILLMLETARRSTEELIKLVTDSEMFWEDSFIEGQAVLNLTNYKKKLASSYYFLHKDICKESSKASCVVHLDGGRLVNKLLDPQMRMNFFPFVLSDSRMAKVLAVGDSSTRSGYLQLVSEHVHGVSPFIQHRWFRILRHCQKIGDGKWVIADISCDYFKTRSNVGPISHVKHPSGCLIQDLGNGWSEVTWVEHVGVDSRSTASLNHFYYIQSGLAFGAKRWVCTLYTAVERALNITYNYLNPTFEPEIDTPWLQSTEGKKMFLDGCNKMISSFYNSMFKSGELKVIQHFSDEQVEVQVAIRKKPVQGFLGFVVCASASVLIPVSANALFDFLCDADKRSKWDGLSHDGARAIAKISMGDVPGNDISIIKPLRDVNYVIIQEVSSNATGKHITFMPHRTTGRSEQHNVGWLPSGFTIFDVSRPSGTSIGGVLWPYGCVLTAVFNFHFFGNDFPVDPNLIGIDHVGPALQTLNSAVGKIKEEFCGGQ